MERQIISLEPEIIQFTADQKQLIKVTNNSNQIIESCYFCLFNANRYEFTPQNFSLQPKQHKLISVICKITGVEGQGKEFAYLKSKNFNKRITLINVDQLNEVEEQKYRSPKSSQQDLRSLSQRAYRQNQRIAHSRIIAQKQAYIDRLERMLEEQESANKSRMYLNQINDLEMKVNLLMKQNIDLRAKCVEFCSFGGHGKDGASFNATIADKMKEIATQAEQIKYLEEKCEEYLKKIAEKEEKLRENEVYYVEKIDSIIREGERRMQEMEWKMVERKKLNKNLLGQNEELKSKLRDYDRSPYDLYEQGNQYDNKMKIERPIESSYRKTGREGHGKTTIEQGRNRKVYEGKARKLEEFINHLQERIKQLREQRIKETDKLHEKVISLKSQNIELIQKMNMNRGKDSISGQQLENAKLEFRGKQTMNDEREDKYRRMIQRYENELKYNERQKQKYKYNEQLLKQKVIEAEQAKDKITKKIEKYRRDARKQLRSIKDNARDELKRIEKQKSKISEKVEELEMSVHKAQANDNRQIEDDAKRIKTKSFYETEHIQNEKSKKNKLRLSHQGHLITKKAEVRNRWRELEESEGCSGTQNELDRIYVELEQLRQFRSCINNSIKRLRELPYIRNMIGNSWRENQKEGSVFVGISFLKELEQKMRKQEKQPQKLLEAQKQVQFLKGRLSELEPLARRRREKENISQQSEMTLGRNEQERSAIEYLRSQMKNQYKKLYDALKLSEETNKTLKQKIHQQYKSKIIQLISKKERDEYALTKIETLLQRFVEGLGNLSHHQAVLAKEVKLKQEARKEVSQLKSKLASVSKSMQHGSKKAIGCIRDHTAMENEKGKEWVGSIKIQARMMTLQAQNARLLQEVNLSQNKVHSFDEQLKLCEMDLQTKEDEIIRLKKQVILITNQNKHELARQEQEMVELKNRVIGVQRIDKVPQTSTKEKQNNHLREQIFEKKQQIKTLKERQKLLEQLLNESKRNQQIYHQKQRKQYMNQQRIHQSLRDLKQNNRQLRTQNSRLKQQIQILIGQINKKNANLKRLKSQKQDNKIYYNKNDQNNLQKLKIQIKQLKQQITKIKEDSDKTKKKKQRQLHQKQSQIDKIKNQYSIEKSSLESIIRALIDTLSGIYCSLDILARKKGCIVSSSPNFNQFIKNPLGIRSSQIRQFFDDIIQAIKT